MNIAHASRGVGVFAAMSLCLLAPRGGLALGPAPESAPPPTQAALAVPMRDGIKLVGDLFLPPDINRRYPTIVELTPYGRGDGRANFRNEASYWADHGFAFLMVDARGEGDSAGEFRFFQGDIEDGHDLVEWIARQAWSNGRVGMRGSSYTGTNQWFAAKSRPPHLTCIVPDATSAWPIGPIPYSGGALKLAWSLSWMSTLQNAGLSPWLSQHVDWSAVLAHRPLLSADEAAYGRMLRLYRYFVSHPPGDSTWRALEFSPADFESMKLPALAFTGWFDGTLPGTVHYFTEMRRHSPAARDQFLIIGPWEHATAPDGGLDYHTGRPVARVGDAHFPEHAFVAGLEIARSFYEWCLKDGPRPQLPAARVYLTGSDRWLDLDEYPPAAARQRELFLDSSGHANSNDGDGRLDWSHPHGAASDAYIYDPRTPAPSELPSAGGGESVKLVSNPVDLRPLLGRADVLVYVSQPVRAPLSILGDVKLVLEVSSDARDTDFVSYLEDIAPNGHGMKLGSGGGAVARARYARGLDREALLTAGVPFEITLDFFDIGHTVLPGHRLRLAVTSSAYPEIGANPNTGNPIATDIDPPRIAHQRVLHDASHRSRLTLPVLPEH